MSKILIKNAVVVTEDAASRILHGCDILIVDDKIAQIQPEIQSEDAQVIDATDMIAMPGFVDAHRHTWECLMRSVGVDWTLAHYTMAVKKMIGPSYTADDQYVASYFGALECIDAGITTLFDWFHNINSPDFSDAAIQGYKDAGMRVVFGYANSVQGELPVSSVPMDYSDFTRVRETYFSGEDGLMTMCLATRGPQFEDIELFQKEMRLAKEMGLFVTMNAGDGIWGRTKPILKLKELGLLDYDYTFIHCNTLSDEEIRIMGDIGAATVSLPEVELNMGHGYPPTLRELRAGIKPALGVDVCTSVPGDMFGPMRFLLAGVRSVVNHEALIAGTSVDPLPLLATDVLHFATQNGADACKLGQKTGSLAVGKQADITLIDTNTLNMMPLNDPVGGIVEAANPGNIDTVIVAGAIKKRNKKLVGVDMAALKKRVYDARNGLFARAGIPTTGGWVPEAYQGKPEMN